MPGTFAEFTASLAAEAPDAALGKELRSLWYDAKGDWHHAHAEVDRFSDPAPAWVHAYLHRKEGDNRNADYWYSKAGKVRPDIGLDAEWEKLVSHFLTLKK